METSELRGILEGKIKMCIGLKGLRCERIRRKGGRLCKACHAAYVRDWRKKKGEAGSRCARIVDGYDFNQDSGDNV